MAPEQTEFEVKIGTQVPTASALEKIGLMTDGFKAVSRSIREALPENHPAIKRAEDTLLALHKKVSQEIIIVSREES
jgi:hypothetical protein